MRTLLRFLRVAGIFAVSFLSAIFAVPSAFTQQKTTAPASSLLPASADTSKVAVVYERVRGHLRYEEDGSGSMTTYAKIRVQSYAGVQQLGQLVFGYDSANAVLEVRMVRVTKADGKIISTGPDAIQDMTSPVAESAPMYTDLRQKHVVVPNLSPGDILEYETRVDSRSLTPGKFWQVWNLISDNICLDEEVELDVPTKVEVKTLTTGASSPEMRKQDDRTIWVWKTSHFTLDDQLVLPTRSASALPDVKTLLVGVQRQATARRIWITSFRDWTEISAWYAALEHEKRIPTPDVRAKAEELTRNSTSNLERTRAIYDYVAHNIRYVSLSFGVGRYQPHAADEVLSHQYGDCKDKATLLESMLEAVGIKAYPVLLHSAGYMGEDIPSPMEFDHAINYVVVDGKELWLDSTLGVAPFAYLLPNVRGKRALVVSPDLGSEVRQIPSELAFPTVYRLDLEGSVDDDRRMDAKIRFETRGDWEILFRLGLLRTSIPQMQSLIEQSARQQSKGEEFALTELDASDPFDTGSPLRMSMRMSAVLPEDKNVVVKDNPELSSKSTLPLTPKDLEEFLNIFLPLADGSATTNLGGPREYAFALKFSLGDKLISKTMNRIKSFSPVPVHLANDFADYDQTWSWDGKLFIANVKLNVKINKIPDEQRAEYAKFRSSLGAQIAEIAYSLGAPRPTGPSLENAQRYSEALAELKAKKFSDAKSILVSLVKEDPKYADAWHSLADLEADQGHWEKANQAYAKLIDVAPTSYSGYSGEIRGYMARQMYDEALATAKKELRNIPDSPEGHVNLGWVYLETGEFALAAKEYEAAARLLPKSVRLQISLGRAYAGASNKVKAKEAFDHATELDSSALTLNDTAYFAAEAGLDLSVAEQRSHRAVLEVEKQLNTIKLEDIGPSTIPLLSRAAAYWDTLGWIKFKRGDIAGAEKYLLAASDLSDAPAIQMHMGRVHESRGNNDAAMRCYVTALQGTQVVYFSIQPGGKTTAQSPRHLSPEEREAKEHLAKLAGSPAEVAEQMKEGSYNRNWKRTVAVPNAQAAEKQESLAVLLSPGPKISSSSILADPSANSTLLNRFGDKLPPQTFPDETTTNLPRLAGIKCMTNPLQCEFEFFPVETAGYAFSQPGSAEK